MLMRHLIVLLALLALSRTADAQFHWKQIPLPKQSTIQGFVLEKSGRIFVTFDSVWYRSSDEGLSWQMLPYRKMWQLVCDSLGRLYHRGEDGDIFIAYSTDQGDSWTQLYSPDIRNSCILSGSAHGLLFSYGTAVVFSSDLGQSWTESKDLMAYADLTFDNLIAGPGDCALGSLHYNSNSAAVHDTTTCIATYKNAGGPIDNSPPELFGVDSKGYCYSGQHRMWRSSTGYVNHFYTFRSLDSGCTWFPIDSAKGYSRLGFLPDGGIVRSVFGLQLEAISTDQGQSWSAILYDSLLMQSKFDHKGILYSVAGQNLFISFDVAKSVASSINNLVSLSAMPNPARATTTIHYSLSYGAFTKWELCDILGRVVRASTLRFESAGEHVESLPLSGLSEGSYVLALQSGPERLSHKIAVINR